MPEAEPEEREQAAPEEREQAAPEEREQTVASHTSAPAGQEQVEQTLGDLDGKVRIAISVDTLEDYLELITATESAAKSINRKVLIEGSAPPSDPRIEVIGVAPDPGVIEVNIHPAATWDTCVHTTETVYEQARQCRLGTDKFMIDGRHTGTGGGNHVVGGGATPADSPFLRHPDLLKSLILFWQRHPSLIPTALRSDSGIFFCRIS